MQLVAPFLRRQSGGSTLNGSVFSSSRGVPYSSKDRFVWQFLNVLILGIAVDFLLWLIQPPFLSSFFDVMCIRAA